MGVPTLDAFAKENSATSASTCSVTITTSDTNDVVVVAVTYEQNSGGIIGVSSPTLGAFTKRGTTLYLDDLYTDTWFCVAPSALTGEVITATWGSGSFVAANMAVWAVNGADTASPWDTNPSLPYTNSFSGSFSDVSVSVSTTGTDAFAFAIAGSFNTTIPAPLTCTNDGNGSNFPIGSAWGHYTSAGAMSGVAIGTNTSGNIYNGLIIVDALASNNSAPSAPTLNTPVNASYADVTSGETFTSTFNSTDGGSQTAQAFRVKNGGSYNYYNAGTNALQSSIVWNSASVLPGGTMTTTVPNGGYMVNGNTLNWSMASQGAGGSGYQGPFASDFTLVTQVGPTVSVTSMGTVTSANPVTSWTESLAGGASQTNYQVIVESGTYGSTPGSGTQVWTSGIVASSALSATLCSGGTGATGLTTGTTYRVFVQITQTGGQTSNWGYTTFTATFDAPAVPTVTALATTDPTTGCPMIKVSVQGLDNYLSANDSSFEGSGSGSVGTWTAGSNTAVAASDTEALDGSWSLKLTPSGAGAISASSGKYAVVTGDEYTFMSSVFAGTTARVVTLYADWYDGASLLSTSTIDSVTDSTSAWTQLLGSAVAPATADYVVLRLGVASVGGSSDVHYTDCEALLPYAGVPITPDSSSFGNNASLIGSPVPDIVASPWSGFGNAFAFNGSDLQYADGGDAATGVPDVAGPTATFTLEAKVMPTAPPANGIGLVCGRHDPAFSYMQPTLWIIDVGGTHWKIWFTYTLYGASGYTDFTGATANAYGTDHDIAVDFDGTTIRLYLDGVVDNSAVVSGPGVAASPPGTPWTIGNNDPTYLYNLVGIVDEVRLSDIQRYGTDYTPASAPFISDADTLALYHLDSAVAYPTWALGGFYGSTETVITRSDGVYVRLASQLNPFPIPTPSQLAVVDDYEVTPYVAYTYTAVVQNSTASLVSAASAASNSAEIETYEWWELDPTNPASAINAQVTTWNPQVTEQSTAHLVLGQSVPNMVASVMGSQDGTCEFQTFTPGTYAGIEALLQSGATVFVSSPWGAIDTGYVRFGPQTGGTSSGTGNKVTDTSLQPSTAVGPYRIVQATFVAQARPPV